MNKLQKARERTSWRRWHIFNTLSYYLGFGLVRGFLFGHRPPASGQDEPPMIGLDRLANQGLMKPDLVRAAKPVHVEYMIRLSKSVASHDNPPSDKQRKLVETFLENHLPENNLEQQKSHFLQLFDEFNTEQMNLRGVCYLVKNSIVRTLVLQFIEFLFALEHVSDNESDNRHHIDRIAEYIGISPADIRRARQDGAKNISEIKGTSN